MDGTTWGSQVLATIKSWKKKSFPSQVFALEEPFSKMTLLHILCLQGDYKCMKIIVKYGLHFKHRQSLNNNVGMPLSFINKTDINGRSILHCAIYSIIHTSNEKKSFWKKLKLIGMLLKFKRELSIDVNCKDSYGDTLLHYLLKCMNSSPSDTLADFIPLIDTILGYSFNINSQNNKKNTILHTLVEYYTNLSTVCDSLLNSFVKYNVNLNLTNKYGDTPLHVAIKDNKLHLVTLLLNSGCDYSINMDIPKVSRSSSPLIHKVIKDTYKNEIQEDQVYLTNILKYRKLILLICSHLDVLALCRLPLCCKALRRITNDDSIWKLHTVPYLSKTSSSVIENSWKLHYRYQCHYHANKGKLNLSFLDEIEEDTISNSRDSYSSISSNGSVSSTSSNSSVSSNSLFKRSFSISQIKYARRQSQQNVSINILNATIVLQSNIKSYLAIKELNSRKVMSIQRNYIVKEILNTEESYISKLKYIIEYYIEPLHVDIDKYGRPQSHIFLQKLNIIFSNIEAIYSISKTIYDQLVIKYSNWTHQQSIADVFMDNVHWLNVYQEYTLNYAKAKDSLTNELHHNFLLHHFFQVYHTQTNSMFLILILE